MCLNLLQDVQGPDACHLQRELHSRRLPVQPQVDHVAAHALLQTLGQRREWHGTGTEFAKNSYKNFYKKDFVTRVIYFL
jgi:hypothetical protein